MQNFNLEACGLVEMNDQEMVNTDGGVAPIVVICLILLAGMVCCSGQPAEKK